MRQALARRTVVAQNAVWLDYIIWGVASFASLFVLVLHVSPLALPDGWLRPATPVGLTGPGVPVLPRLALRAWLGRRVL